MSQLKNIQREGLLFYSAFYSIQAFGGLDKAHPHLGRHCALLSLLIQMLIPSRTTSHPPLPQKCLIQYLGTGQLTVKINHHTDF